MIFEMMFVRNFRHRSSFVNWQQIFVTKSIPLLQDQQKHNDILKWNLIFGGKSYYFDLIFLIF